MFGKMIRGSMLALAAVTLMGAVGTQAKAAHVDYCFTGECLGFEAESHMTRSLELMEKAYQTRNVPQYSQYYAYKAVTELRYAARELQSARATSYVGLGMEDLRSFMVTGDIGELDHAAKHVTDGIRAEQILHRHDDHHHHHGQAVQPVQRTVRYGQWGQSYGYQGYRQNRSGSLQVGGNWGGIRIRF